MILIAHLLPPGDSFWADDETQISLAPDPQLYYDSLTRWIREAQPSVLIEHQTDGGAVGKVAHGYSTDRGYFAIIEVRDDIRPRENAAYRFVSPRIRFDYRGIDGLIWPAALLELSLVSVPRFAHQLPLDSDGSIRPEVLLSALSPSVKADESTTKPSNIVDTEEGFTIEEFVMNPEVKAEIAAMIAEAIAGLMPSAPEPEVEVEVEEAEMAEEIKVEEAEEVKMADYMLEDLLAMSCGDRAKAMLSMDPIKMAELLDPAPAEEVKVEEEEKVDEAVMSALRTGAKERGLTPERTEALLSLARIDAKAAEAIMSAVPVRRSAAAPSAAPRRKATSADPFAEAHRIADERGITYKEALRIAQGR